MFFDPGPWLVVKIVFFLSTCESLVNYPEKKDVKSPQHDTILAEIRIFVALITRLSLFVLCLIVVWIIIKFHHI